MKTRINKKNETVTITVDHNELTYLWLALDTHSYHLKENDCFCSAKYCEDLSEHLLKTAVRLGIVETENGSLAL